LIAGHVGLMTGDLALLGWTSAAAALACPVCSC
jgi:hypothetical protein